MSDITTMFTLGRDPETGRFISVETALSRENIAEVEVIVAPPLRRKRKRLRHYE